MRHDRVIAAASGPGEAMTALAAQAGDACFPRFDDAQVARIAAEVTRSGACLLRHAIAPERIAAARAQAEAAVAANGGEYVARTGAQPGAGYLLNDIHADPDFAHLLARLYRAATGCAAEEPHVHQVLRCLQGWSGLAHAGYLHYDSYAVTILVPLAVPTDGPAGDLVLLPNARPIRRFYLANAIEKVLYDRKAVQRWLWRRIHGRGGPVLRIRPEPGSVLIFWGYRSLHANEASDPGGLRATLLYHFGNPHAGSRLRRWRRRD